jgi:site-specific recombinase XerD
MQTDSVTGPPISECIEKYLTTREQDLDSRTLNQPRIALEGLQRFLEARNVVHIREMTVDHLERFKTVGLPKKMRLTTKATAFAKIRCFLRSGFRRGWIKEALIDKVTTVKAVYDQKEPYSDEEIAAIFDHASQLDGGTHGYAKQPRTFWLLLELMLATGMRVGDAVTFDPRALSKGDALRIYTYQPQKQKRSEKAKLLEASSMRHCSHSCWAWSD